jgi:hypothetical protein
VGHVLPVTVFPELEVALYPNPNRGTFQVHLEGESWEQSELAVFNALGQEVGFERLPLDQDNIQLRMKEEMPGVYFLKLTTKSGRQTSLRFVVE